MTSPDEDIRQKVRNQSLVVQQPETPLCTQEERRRCVSKPRRGIQDVQFFASAGLVANLLLNPLVADSYQGCELLMDIRQPASPEKHRCLTCRSAGRK